MWIDLREIRINGFMLVKPNRLILTLPEIQWGGNTLEGSNF